MAEAIVFHMDTSKTTKQQQAEDYEHAIDRHVGQGLRDNPDLIVDLRRRIAADIRSVASGKD